MFKAVGCHHCGRKEVDEDTLPPDIRVLPTRTWKEAHQILLTFSLNDAYPHERVLE
jgi:hypothetical protein